MNYTEVRRYIDDAYKRGSIYGLDAIKALMNELGNPQDNLRIVHIAGTNGKGSVGTFISQVLTEAGYRVGRFVSPTIYCYEERFQINGEYISEESLASCMSAVAEAAEAIDYDPTGFELETAAALCYFSTEACDLAVVECGLGGAQDATNVIEHNLLTVLTSISLDHTAILGDTIEAVTREKCGIIRDDTEVITIEQESASLAVIKEVCGDGIPLGVVKKTDIKNKRLDGLAQCFDYGKYGAVKINMLGDYQLENAALALECIAALTRKGFTVAEGAIYKGMSKAHWGGRFEVISTDPVFILDGAHNPDAALRLKTSVETYLHGNTLFGGKRLIFIIGVFADKDYDGILSLTAPLADEILAVQAPTQRGLALEKLVTAVKRYNSCVKGSELGTAVDYCLSREDCVTIAFGTLSFMGEITRLVKQRQTD